MSNGKKILEGLSEVLAHVGGHANGVSETLVHVPAEVDVKAVRENLGMSQTEFALRFGFALGTLRGWEQGRRQPDGTARVLLTVIAREPVAVRRALALEAA